MSKEIKELEQVFERLNNEAEKLNSFDLWDDYTMQKILNAENFVRKAMTEIIEITGGENT